MKFSILKEHRDFFQKQQLVEFNNLIPQNKLHEINQEIDQSLATRLNTPIHKLKQQTPQTLFLAGRDIWRENVNLKKIITSSYLAEIASELIEFKPLRLGYDQVFSKYPTKLFIPNSEWDQDSQSLAERSCLQGVLCGLMLCLSTEEETPNKEYDSNLSIFSKTAGSGVYFSSSMPFDFSDLNRHFAYRYILIVYTHPTTFYIHEERDSHLHALKKLGYVFNDKLNDKLHPILYR